MSTWTSLAGFAEPGGCNGGVMRSAARVLVIIVGLLLVVALALFLVADYSFRQRYESRFAAVRNEMVASVDDLCAAQQELSADPFFHQQRVEGNAGPLLNRWIGWDSEPPPGSPLVLPANLEHTDTTWLTTPPDVSALDFSWMEKLHAYDHWDLTTDSDFAANLSWHRARTPRFRTLSTWARLRLVRGRSSGDMLAAAKDLRQLAWLSYQTDTGEGAVFAAGLLNLEAQAYKATQSPPSDWTPMPDAQVARFEAVAGLAWVYSSVVASPEISAKARSCGTPPVTRCLGLTEGAVVLRTFGAVDVAASRVHEDAIRAAVAGAH